MEMNKDAKLVNWLFETGAFRVSPAGNPFWYTSGTIGPYYINTHFLYGSEKKAVSLLGEIDSATADRFSCPEKIRALVETNYNEDSIFKGLIDLMHEYIIERIGTENIAYISGGERRDWFFSLMLAKLLDKPHISIFKDMSAVITDSTGTKEAASLNGGRVLHIADLITEASSYERAWIPAISGLNGKMDRSLVVVDRMQGGAELLGKFNVASHAMVTIDSRLFDKALELGLIDSEQQKMLNSYAGNPRESMKEFINSHPDFLENALVSDSKTAERAKLCIEKGFYK